MSVKIIGKYLGNLKVELTHEESGAKITTSAPKDNNGDGASFSPTDLVAGAMGACFMTIIGIIASKKRLDVEGSYFEVEKHMSAEPRRIGKLVLNIHLPARLAQDQRESLEKHARTCPVHHSLHPEIESVVEFIYDI